FNLDPADAERRITPRTKAIMVVHQMGMPADLDAFLDIGRRRGVKIFEDGACALGSRYKGRPIGAHSEMVCFSFHPRKVISTGDGGMVTTNNAAYADKMRLLRQHGMSVTDAARHAAKTVVIEEYPILGYNFRLTDLQAAVGLEQMKRLDGLIARRVALAERYALRIRQCALPLVLPFVPDYAQPNFQSYPVILSDECRVSRNEVLQRLLDAGIAARRGIMTAHREKAYTDAYGPQSLPITERTSDRSLLLPLFPQMTDSEQDRVVEALCKAVIGNGKAASGTC
ncbi:MAG: DegT/DnrJ/EryC1/StrS family aminotransferase, partial [Verrucomicrobiae bacterium]|nr:DegT/DnrJ/EryC1/StrS family aminotransferase [Verrucomicrobiae bacterium]